MDHATKGLRPPAIPFVDELGRKCLRVPLDRRGNAYATVLEQDYEQVREAGAIGPWLLNSSGQGRQYVRTSVQTGKDGRTLVTVSRMIAGAGPRSTIYYANKDSRDLRPENLFWHRNGKAKRNDAELAQRGKEIRQERCQ